MINEAIQFITSKVHDPALAHPSLPKEIKSKVRSTKIIINNFKRVGDLYKYLSRFSNNLHGGGGREMYDEMTKYGLETHESIFEKFEKKFKYEINDFTVLTDFVIGQTVVVK